MSGTSTRSAFTLANKITILRTLLVPGFILALFYYLRSEALHQPVAAYRWTAFSIFVLASVTDALDGFLARRRNEITRLGRILDPLADKALLLSAIIMLSLFHPPMPAPSLPPWYALIVISRDAILLVGAGIVHALVGRVEVQPRFLGKCATVLQMISVVWVLGGWIHPWFYFVLVITAAVTLAAGGLYIYDGLRQIEHAHPGHHQGSLPTSS